MDSNQIALDQDSVEIVLNPRWPAEDYKNLYNLAKTVSAELGLSAHIWVATSGSTATSISGTKLVALSKKALLASARAVNQHLQSNAQDIWAQVLPLFHVGGLGIEARAFLSGAKRVSVLKDFKWDVNYFYRKIQDEKCTLTSLVPTQVYDLVKARLPAPPDLRAVIVGGGPLSIDLYLAARELGWPLLPSYGMTETCSQIATANLASLEKKEFPQVGFLNHVQVRTSTEGFLQIRGDSLLTCYAQMQGEQPRHWDPKLDSWFQAEDKVSIENNVLKILGRSQDYIKIGGESVLLGRLREKLEMAVLEKAPHEALAFVLVEMPSERLGFEIELFFESHVAAEAAQQVQSAYNESVLPFERIRAMRVIAKIPRTELGKIRYSELKNIKDGL